MISFSIIPSLNSENEAGELICSTNWVKRICRRLSRETFVELACNPDVWPVPFSAFDEQLPLNAARFEGVSKRKPRLPF